MLQRLLEFTVSVRKHGDLGLWLEYGKASIFTRKLTFSFNYLMFSIFWLSKTSGYKAKQSLKNKEM